MDVILAQDRRSIFLPCPLIFILVMIFNVTEIWGIGMTVTNDTVTATIDGFSTDIYRVVSEAATLVTKFLRKVIENKRLVGIEEEWNIPKHLNKIVDKRKRNVKF